VYLLDALWNTFLEILQFLKEKKIIEQLDEIWIGKKILTKWFLPGFTDSASVLVIDVGCVYKHQVGWKEEMKRKKMRFGGRKKEIHTCLFLTNLFKIHWI